MPFEEGKRYPLGKKKTDYYNRHLEKVKETKKREEKYFEVVKSEDLPWEDSRQGRIKHLVNEEIPTRMKGLDVYIQELPPGERSGRHRHMAEEFLFILEGKGYDLHWDVDAEIGERYDWKASDESKKFEWEEWDVVYIPPNTVHQHFNADPDKPARFISASSSLYRYLGYDDLEQIVDAPKTKK